MTRRGVASALALVLVTAGRYIVIWPIPKSISISNRFRLLCVRSNWADNF